MQWRAWVVAGACDNTFLDLIFRLGWQSDLVAVKEELAPSSRMLLEAKLAEQE